MARTTLLAVTLLLLVSMALAARTVPSDPSKVHPEVTEDPGQGIPGGDEGCEGVGEEECLARRTFNAHTDYIYTQEKGN